MICHLQIKPSQRIEVKKVLSFVEDISKISFEQVSPFYTFFKSLLIDFDFEESQKEISNIQNLLGKDSFLSSLPNSLTESCKYFFFETYCKLYKGFTFSTAAEFLGCSVDEAEMWIVQFFQKFQIEAKIAPESQTVTIIKQSKNFNSQILSANRDLNPRTQLIMKNIQKLIN